MAPGDRSELRDGDLCYAVVAPRGLPQPARWHRRYLTAGPGEGGRFGPGLRSRCHRSSRPGAGSGQSGAVVGRVGDSAVLGCDLLGAQPGRPPLYVIEWVRVGFVLPIFIKFGLYSPRVDPEYSGEGSAWGPGGGGGVGVGAAVGWGGWEWGVVSVGCCPLWVLAPLKAPTPELSPLWAVAPLKALNP